MHTTKKGKRKIAATTYVECVEENFFNPHCPVELSQRTTHFDTTIKSAIDVHDVLADVRKFHTTINI